MTVKDALIGQRLGDYEIVDLIGRGGMGTVYRARDPREQRDVALKVLGLDRLEDAREVDRFEREVQLAAGLDHPNIVAVYGSGRDAGHLYMAMELVEGQSLRDLLRQGKLGLEQSLAVASQVLAGLEQAHAKRIVHRDIKAENVLVQADGTAKVLDFGVAKLEGGTVLTRVNEILGTVEYMAPEQILGDAVGPATDLYATGVLLYEMLTGVLPFTGDSPATLVYHQLNEEPHAPSFLNPMVSRALDRLVLKLLDKIPENRHGSAREGREALEEIRRRQQMLDIPSLDLVDQPPDQETELRTRNFLPRFVGRQEELGELRIHFNALGQGGRVVFLAGEAGAGKTRVLEEFARYVEEHGGRSMRGTCFFDHGMGPYMPVLDALGDLLTRRVGGLSDAERQSLAQLLEETVPELAGLVTNPGTTAKVRASFSTAFGTEQNQEAARQRFFDVIFDLLTAVAREKPLVLVLEDVHWADEGSQELLNYLARRAPEIGLLCLATYRPEELAGEEDEGTPLAQIMKQLAAEDRLQEVRLDRLERDVVAQLARSIFLEAAFSQDFVDFLFEQSQGNPFIAVEVLKLLRQREVLYCESGVWSTRPEFAETVVPDRVNALVMRRVDLLDDEPRELLELAAVCGPSFTSKLLEGASGLGRIPLLKVLFRLEKQHRLIEAIDGGYAFSHSKIREVLYGEIPPELQREYHRLVGAVLEEQGEDGQAVADEELGNHLYRGGEYERALPCLTRAGEEAYRMFSWRQAVSLLEAAIDSARRSEAAPEEVERALILLGRSWENLTALDRALERFEELGENARQAGRPAAQGDAWIHVGRVRERLGQPEEAERAYEQAVGCLKEGEDGGVRGRALLNWGTLDFEMGRYERAEERWQEAHALLQEAVPEEGPDVLNNLAVLATVRGDLDGAWALYEQVMEGCDPEEPSMLSALTQRNMGMLRADQERWDDALELYGRSLDTCRRIRFIQGEPEVEINRAEALIGKMNLVGGREACSQALRGFRRLDDGLGVADALRLYGRICRLERSWDEGRTCLEKSVALNREFGETVSLGEAFYELGLLEQEGGEREAALAALQEAEQLFVRIEAAPDLERVRAALEALQEE